jgi:hypothetical protein
MPIRTGHYYFAPMIDLVSMRVDRNRWQSGKIGKICIVVLMQVDVFSKLTALVGLEPVNLQANRPNRSTKCFIPTRVTESILIIFSETLLS